MSQSSNATKGGTRNLFPFEGKVTNIRRATGTTKNGTPQDYAIFTFAYGVKGRDGQVRVQTRTAKAFGACLTAVAPALVEGNTTRLLCEFDTTKLGQTLKAIKIAPPRKEAQAA